jgi:hypothetical protein
MWSASRLFARQLIGNASTTIGEAVFSVQRGPCCDYVRDTVEGRRRTKRMGIQRSTAEYNTD